MNQTIENSQNEMGQLATTAHLLSWFTVELVRKLPIGDRPLKQRLANSEATHSVVYRGNDACSCGQPNASQRRPTAKSYPPGGLSMVAT